MEQVKYAIGVAGEKMKQVFLKFKSCFFLIFWFINSGRKMLAIIWKRSSKIGLKLRVREIIIDKKRIKYLKYT